MLEYEFMRNAFVAGSAVAIVGGAVGFFLVLRNLIFASHALSHVGFAGAAVPGTVKQPLPANVRIGGRHLPRYSDPAWPRQPFS